MEDNGHITKVTEPTHWVSSMVVSERKGKLRICIDPKDLNKAIKREHYPIKTIEEVISTIEDAKVFSCLDAKSGFLQLKLDDESSQLTTFNTPDGRYRWLRLPFGIRSAPEIYQRVMDTMLEDIPNATAIMDDILVTGKDEKHHDKTMHKVVERATEWNLKLNLEKCRIKQSSVPYIGHLITAEGLRPDLEKVRAVEMMPDPQCKEDVKRFLGFIQYLEKFIPNLSQVDEPLRRILKAEVDFSWDKPQRDSFAVLKKLVCTAPVLAFYDVNKPVTIQCDASSFSIGAALLQETRPVAYTSRAMTGTEQGYAQIEKEMLAIVHSCKKFHTYIYGKTVKVETNHKPLETILKKPLLSSPMRLQRMLLQLQAYDLEVSYRRGKDMQLADTLSRTNLPDTEHNEEFAFINMTNFISVSDERYTQFRERTQQELSALISIVQSGWPNNRQKVQPKLRPYWKTRDELSVVDGIVYKGTRIVVPPSMRNEMKAQVQESHQGIVACRARKVMYWPGMSSQIEDECMDCSLCQQFQNNQPKEPLQPTSVPDLPWIELGADILAFGNAQYLATVDYWSKFIEVDKLHDTTSTSVIEATKSHLARHGIPKTLRTDNGPQFSSREFESFCRDYQIKHVTSSPYYAQSNGEAERAVQTVKRMWQKCVDKHLALLNYRTTPLPSINQSPAQLLMNRRPRNLLPASGELLQPQSPNTTEVKQSLQRQKDLQKSYYDRRAGRPLPELEPGDPVRMAPLPGQTSWRPATAVAKHTEPQSYIVDVGNTNYRRNRQHLRKTTARANAGQRPEHSQPAANTRASQLRLTPQALPLSVPQTPRREHPLTPETPAPASTPARAPLRAEIAAQPDPPELPTAPQSPYRSKRSGWAVKPPCKLDL